jgi:amidase
VPITVKENIDVAGSATTLGIVPLAGNVARADAPHIAELRAAGAIPFARTNMPEFGTRWHTENALRGATRNPWSAAHTPGASSGGEAAALASGMSPLGMGNDGRIAALAGALRGRDLKRRSGAWRWRRGPADPVRVPALAVHGPMARRVRDLRLAFRHVRALGRRSRHAPPRSAGRARHTDPCRARDRSHGPALARAHRALQQAADACATRATGRRAPRARAVRAGEIYTQIMSRWSRVQEVLPPVEARAALVRALLEGFNPEWERARGRTRSIMMERASIARAWAGFRRDPARARTDREPAAFRVGEDLEPAWCREWPARIRA